MKKRFILFLLILLLIPAANIYAASGVIDIYTSSKNVTIGNTVTITSYCISNNTTIGVCEFTLTYDSNKLKLVSSDVTNCNGNLFCSLYTGSKKSNPIKFVFKTIATGSTTVSAKSAGMYSLDSEEAMSTTVSGTTFNINAANNTSGSSGSSSSTQTYSTNNNLSSLSVEGYNLSPTFNKNILEYTTTINDNKEQITINATAEDNKSKISGNGTIQVTEGTNKILINVTSEKGTIKTYIINATIVDSNPIKVTIDNNEYTVIKRKSAITIPNETYKEKIISINNIDIPSFYSEITDYTLVGLKDKDGNINLYIYDENKKTYSLYQEFSFNSLKLNIINSNNIPNGYKKTLLKIKDKEVNAYASNSKTNYYLIYATNIETGTTNWYSYESTENTIQIFNQTLLENYNKKIDQSKNIIIYLACGISIISILLIIVIISKNHKKSKISKKQNFDFGEDKKIEQENKTDLIKQQMEQKIKDIEKKKKKKRKKDKQFDLEWTKEVKKVDNKIILDKENKTTDIKVVEQEIKKLEKNADLEQKQSK